MRKLVVGNWKMHGGLDANAALLVALREAGGQGCPSAVCVPFPYLQQAKSLLEGSAIAWGAQDLSEHAVGAYTGEVSGAMLNDFGCRYVIVGHSERRALFGDTDGRVAAKVDAALAVELQPILCVGETLDEREGGVTESVVERQLKAVLERGGAAALAACVIAYEPVWAIGTGRVASAGDAQEVCGAIRAKLGELSSPQIAEGVRVLYGGSMNAKNVGELIAQPDVDGGLVGGASLDGEQFATLSAIAAGGPLP